LDEHAELEEAATAVRAWVVVGQQSTHDEDDLDDGPDDMELQEASDLFEEVLRRNGTSIEVRSDSPFPISRTKPQPLKPRSNPQALLGRARVAEMRGDMTAALDAVNEVHVRHSWFAPALMDKLRVALPVHGWPEVMDAAAQLQQLDANNVMVFAYTGACCACGARAALAWADTRPAPQSCTRWRWTATPLPQRCT